MLWSQQVEKEEEKARPYSSFISSPFGPIPTISKKMLSLYYDPLDLSNPVKATQFLVILGSQTFKQVTKVNPSQNELASSSTFSSKQIVVTANPTPLSSKSHYWQKDLNEPIMVIEREFFNEDPKVIAANGFEENFHYPSSDLLKTRDFYIASQIHFLLGHCLFFVIDFLKI